MKFILFILSILLLASCNQQPASTSATPASVDSLAAQVKEIKDKYKPGLGEFMEGIQLHHGKLWFAGINNNWPLANYEIGEIKEDIESIKEIETDRPEIKSIPMIDQPLANLSSDIDKKDEEAFRKDFQLLTSTCNACHQANQHGFNIITIPTAPPVTNQDFKAGQ